MIIKVSIINLPIKSAFDYLVPSELASQVKVGQLVAVPFNIHQYFGVVIEINCPHPTIKLLPITSIVQVEPILSPERISVAMAIADRYLDPLSQVFEMMLPTKFTDFAEFDYSISDGTSLPKSQAELQITEVIREKGPITGKRLVHLFPNLPVKPMLAKLVKLQVLHRSPRLPKAVASTKYGKTAAIAITWAEYSEYSNGLGRTSQTNERRKLALEYLFDEGIPVSVQWVFASSGCTMADLKELAEREFIILAETEIFRDPLERIDHRKVISFGENPVQPENKEFRQIIDRSITGEMDGSTPPSLLYKNDDPTITEQLYLSLVMETVKNGRSALVLTPEATFTPRFVRLFTTHFPGLVGLYHGRMSDGEKYDTWMRVNNGRLKVVVGTRSALFLPIHRLGAVIIDECHDVSYRQENSPVFDSLYVAELLKKRFATSNIYGSPTLPVELVYRARYSIIDERYGALEMVPPVEIRTNLSHQPLLVDMRQELKTGNNEVFSRALHESIMISLDKEEQVVLFLNRRGDSSYIFCRDCGTSLHCEKCATVLVEHTQPGSVSTFLLCHWCGYGSKKPSVCPSCGSKAFRSFGLGVEKLEQKCKQLFPNARTVRWDRDTVQTGILDELALTHFANHNADILIGTQMIAKNYTFPKVTTIGFVLADVGLNLPDPFINERLFHLYSEILKIGGGRTHQKAFIQTFQPDHPLLKYLSSNDSPGFYEWELQNRSKLGLPPFKSITKLEYRNQDARTAEIEAYRIAGKLRTIISAKETESSEVLGPLPAYFIRRNDEYYWQIVLKNFDLKKVNELSLGVGWKVIVDPISL